VIAAATHPEIGKIPAMVVAADSIELRAKAFIGHNRNRLQLTPGQLYYSPEIRSRLLCIRLAPLPAWPSAVFLPRMVNSS
jgi:hypothetical protein